MASCGEETAESYHSGEQWNNGKRRYTNEGYSDHKKPKKEHFRSRSCPFHPKGSHSKQDCHLWKQMLQEASQHSKQGTRNHKPSNLCRYCKKTEYVPGHTCQKYWDAKRKVVANRAAK
ncbi:hypothetical protein DFQ29_004044, partial [Apophysomyces sp. BC1021]